MAIDPVGIGSAPNAGDGDPARTAFEKTNASVSDLDGRIVTAEGDASSIEARVASLEASAAAAGVKFLKVLRSTNQTISDGVTTKIAFDTVLFDTTGGILSWSAADPENIHVNADCFVRVTMWCGFAELNVGGMHSVNSDDPDDFDSEDFALLDFTSDTANVVWQRGVVTGHIVHVSAGSVIFMRSTQWSGSSRPADKPRLTFEIMG